MLYYRPLIHQQQFSESALLYPAREYTAGPRAHHQRPPLHRLCLPTRLGLVIFSLEWEVITIVKNGIVLAIDTLVALGLADYLRTAAVSRRRVDNMSFMLVETSAWGVVLMTAMLLRGKGFSMSPKLIGLPALAGLL